MPKVKLHRCQFTFLHTSLDACWNAEKALRDQGIEYEVVKHNGLKKGNRPALEALSGQSKLPVIEFEDGSAYREESKDMAKRIRAGELFS
ncbi:hypothetical protein GKE82_09425 [Conexibacter sp. W3-3-2]|uniref:glutathione S-transferase N-terminal domain-containing protein n=1 Tax=Conexibacter sp. W3-3-2 TaxID=2675227 RepID=UPI0012B70D04|nr:glutathione S-transferase N-terminal domain-containing protein [Conexibacter sp. W3-3-2]MTD44505.1 hypothetical protein [Conexibacter sp. W3-3-2]